jgi:sugar O-acyltransferase (sialic acid O-acetyltransferase NeuD family)
MNNKPVIIMGAGGHTKVLMDALKQQESEILGVVTPEYETGYLFNGIKVLGSDETVYEYNSSEISLVNGLGALPGNIKRWKIAETMRKQGYHFRSVIHPNATIAISVKIEEGVQVMAGAVIQTDCRIGCDTIINTGVVIDHDCEIGGNCHIAPGVVFSGGVTVGNCTHIGTGTTVIQNITIGNNSVVASGSVIYKDIPGNVTLVQIHQTEWR